ncbi:MAG: EAL domain-containing protein [Clostridia bacterium]|nr:EAL domain-containing protein [Clostridia bacterium]
MQGEQTMENSTSPGKNASKSKAFMTEASRTLLENFKQGIENDEFILLAQPVFDLASGQITSAEILVQWHQGQTDLLPGEFLPQLEENQIGGELDFYVLAHSLQAVAESLGGRSSFLPLSFNLSEQLLQSPGFVERITGLVEAFAIEKPRVWFEIRQDVLQASNSDLHDQIVELHQEGFRIVADHVTLDPWKLAQLSVFPVHALKVPVAHPDGSRFTLVDQAAFSMIIQSSREHNRVVIGVNVEHQHEVDFLQQSGLDLAQGYFLARPMPLFELLHSLESR